MSGAPRVHLSYLDGLRGWASLFVLLHHIWQFVVGQVDLGVALPGWFKLMTVFKYGPLAVTVFIVLSGYSLMLPVARSETLTFSGGLKSFFKRRALRILPAYYATIAFSVLLLWLHPAMRQPSGTQWDMALPALSLENLGLHALLLHNLFPSFQWKLNPPLWSVALEWQIYFIFALILLPVWRRFGRAAGLLLALVLGCAPLFFGAAHVHSWYIASFAIGMWAADANFGNAAWRARLSRVPFGLVSLLLLVPVAAWLVLLKGNLNDVDDWAPLVAVHLATSLSACAFLVGSTRAIGQGQSSFLVRFFEHRVSETLGRFSYSLYLLHYPLLAAVSVSLRELRVAGLPLFVALLAAVPLVLGICFAFYALFEKPYLRARGSSVAMLPAPAAR